MTSYIQINQSTDTTHGRVIDLVLASAKSSELKNLIAMCTDNAATHLHLSTYYAPKDEARETLIRVRGDDGTDYDLDNPGTVNWTHVSQTSPITITVRMNTGYVSGFSENVETFLHEMVVHAAKYVPFIQQMREAPDKRLLERLWSGAAQSSNSGAWQHSWLGRGRDRALSQDIRAAGKAMEDRRLEEALNTAHQSDVRNHQ